MDWRMKLVVVFRQIGTDALSPQDARVRLAMGVPEILLAPGWIIQFSTLGHFSSPSMSHTRVPYIITPRTRKAGRCSRCGRRSPCRWHSRRKPLVILLAKAA